MNNIIKVKNISQTVFKKNLVHILQEKKNHCMYMKCPPIILCFYFYYNALHKPYAFNLLAGLVLCSRVECVVWHCVLEWT